MGMRTGQPNNNNNYYYCMLVVNPGIQDAVFCEETFG